MKLSLFCSGLSHLYDESVEGRAGGFYRSPRISMARNCQQFLPDYALLFLADELVMGRKTFEGLIRGQIETVPSVPLMVKLLHDEGRIRLEDFEDAFREHQPALEKLVENEMERLEAWLPMMWKSVSAWQAYFEGLQLTLRPRAERLRQEVSAGRLVPLNYARPASAFVHHMGGRYQMVRYYAEEILASVKEGADGDSLRELREFLHEQLIYVIGSLLLARKFSASLHDWCDFEAHYGELFARPAAPDTAPPVTELFQISVPELILWHPDNVLKVLRDGRLLAVREEMRAALAGTGAFNTGTAEAVLDDLASSEPGVGRVRLITVSRVAAPGALAGAIPGNQPFLHFSSHSVDEKLAEQKRAELKAL